MEQQSKNDLMNSRPTMLLSDFNNPQRGMLIGFKAFAPKDDRITAAYQIWDIKGDTLTFVLYFNKSTGKPVLDATRICEGNPIYINKEPFEMDIEIATASPFPAELAKIFNLQPTRRTPEVWNR